MVCRREEIDKFAVFVNLCCMTYENNNPFKDINGKRLPSRIKELEAAGLDDYTLISKSMAKKAKIPISAEPVAARYNGLATPKLWYALHQVTDPTNTAFIELRTAQGWKTTPDK